MYRKKDKAKSKKDRKRAAAKLRLRWKDEASVDRRDSEKEENGMTAIVDEKQERRQKATSLSSLYYM